MGWRDDEVIEYAPQVSRRASRSSWQDDEVIEYAPGQRAQTDQPAYTEEDRRRDQLRANQEAALAQEWKASRKSNLPSIRAGAIRLGAGFVAPVAELFGAGKFADRLNRLSAVTEQVQQEREKGGPMPDWLQRNLRGAGVSLVDAWAAGMFMGPKGIIGKFTATQASQAKTEGQDAGLKGRELAEHVLWQATAEAAPALAMQKVGLGGFETLMGGGKRAIASGFKEGAKQFGKGLVVETGEELVTEGAQLVGSELYDVDPEALSSESLWRTAGDTVAQTFLAFGAASGPALAASYKQGKFDKAVREIPLAAERLAADPEAEISRKAYRSWGLPPNEGLSRATRKEVIQDIAAGIKQADAAEAAAKAAAQDPQGAAETRPQAESIKLAEVPEQALGAPEGATSLANAAVAEQREQRGVEQLPAPEPETLEQWLDTANKLVADSPSKPGRLVEELLQAPRAIGHEEHAILSVGYRKLSNEFGIASDALFAAQKSGDKFAIKQASDKSNALMQELEDIETVSSKAGTAAGRSLVSRKLAINRDYSLGAVVRRLRVAKGGQELTQREAAIAAKTSKELAEKQAQEIELGESIESQNSEEAVDRFIKRSTPKKRFKKRTLAKTAEAKERVNVAMAAFKAKLAQKRGDGGVGRFVGEESGAVDLELVAPGVELVKAYADLGVSTFAEFFTNVKAFLGDGASMARDSLRAAWTQAQEAGLISRPQIDPSDTAAMSKFAKKVAKSVIESGVTNRDEVVASVHEELQAISPDITHREAMDAVSGYGIYSELSKDEASTTLRDLSGQLRQLAKLEDIQAGQEPRRSGVERRTQSEEELQLTGQVKEAMRKAGITREVDDAARTAAYKRTLTKRVADLKRRIKEGDFSKPAKRKIKLDEDALSLKYESKVLKDRLDAMERKFKNSQLKGFKKAYYYAGEISNLGRAMKTSFDMSGLLRQGKPAVGANPKLARAATEAMFRAYWSKELAYSDSEAIKNHPRYRESQKAGLAITDIEGKLTTQEEAFRGELSRVIPGVAGSERAYVAGLNQMRIDYYSQLMNDLEAGGWWRKGGEAVDEMTRDKEQAAIANIVNVFTGRGSYAGQNQAAAQFLATFIFSPRFVMSRFQFVSGQPAWGGTSRTRKMAAREYARTASSMATIYSLAAVAGFFALKDEDRPQFEWDLNSSEFLKIRWGDVILDPAAGISQVLTMLSRIWTGETKSPTGAIIPLRGPDVPFGGEDLRDKIARFGWAKLAPLPAAAVNSIVGETIIGDETSWTQEAIELPVPLSFGDIADALHAEGYSLKSILVMLAWFGDGVNRYESADPARFGEAIVRHPELEGKQDGERFSYTEEVQQILDQLKKKGWSESKILRALHAADVEKGLLPKTIRRRQRLASERIRGR